MSAPRRLFDDPAAPEALREDLRVAAEAEPRYDAARGLLALQAAVAALGHGTPLAEGVHQAASSATEAAGSTSAAGQAGAAAKLGGALAGVPGGKLTIAALATALGLAGSVAWISRAPEAPATRPAPAVVAPAPAVVPAAVEAPAPVVAPALPAAAEATPVPAAPHAARPQHGGAVAPVDKDLALRNEIDHLARVKALLERDPKAAYQLAQAGNRTLSSMFRQERDGLSVLALEAAGEHARARRLARLFVERHPDSPLHERIAKLLEPAAEPR